MSARLIFLLPHYPFSPLSLNYRIDKIRLNRPPIEISFLFTREELIHIESGFDREVERKYLFSNTCSEQTGLFCFKRK